MKKKVVRCAILLIISALVCFFSACAGGSGNNNVSSTAHTHDYVSKVVKQPTCSTEGVVKYTCSCGDAYTTSIAELEHNYIEKITRPATCKAEGVKTYTCTCGDSYTEKIQKTEHNYTSTVIQPTCTKQGYTTWLCSGCGDSYVDSYVGLISHAYMAVETKKATCTSTGVITHACVCGDSYTEVVPAIGHKYTQTPTLPTCTSSGYTTHTCSQCGDSYTDDYVPASGHKFSDAWTTDENEHWRISICQHTGLVKDRAAHIWDEGEITIQPTETREGVKTFTCTTCKKTKTETMSMLKKVYTVRFLDSDGSVLKEESVLAGEAATAPNDPEKEGYRFIGWNKPYINIDSDTEIIATYVQTVIVKFLDYNNVVLEEQIVDIGNDAERPEDPKRDNYEFVGWDVAFTSVQENLTVQAVYVRLYTVTFVDYDGSELKTQQVREGGDAIAPQELPTRTGHTFTGWDQAYDNIQRSITVTATYLVNEYTVTFLMPNGTLIERQKVVYTLWATAPSVAEVYFNWDRELVGYSYMRGYAFTGWDKEFNRITEDTVVTAIYGKEVTEPILVVDAEACHNLKEGDKAKVRVYLCGNLSVYGLDMGLKYADVLNVKADGDVVINDNFKTGDPNFASLVTKLQNVERSYELSWSNGQTAIVCDGYIELMSIAFEVDGRVDQLGDYFIDIFENTYLITDKLEKVNPIIVSGYVTIVE